jgi:cysteine-rich repeat protein
MLAGMLLAAGTADAWYYRLDPEPRLCGGVYSVAAGGGDVYAAGLRYECIEEGSYPVIVKLRGSNGAELWRRESLPGVAGECLGPVHLEAAPGGGVALTGVSGPCFDDGFPDEVFAARLSAGGDVAWLENLGEGYRLSTALAGNVQVVLAGVSLVGLDVASGATLWRSALEAEGLETRISATGRVLTVVHDGAGLRVLAHHVATGAPVWSTAVPGQYGFPQRRLWFGTQLGIEFAAVTAGTTVTVLSIQDGTPYWTRTLPLDAIFGAAFDDGQDQELVIGGFFRGPTSAPTNLLLLEGYLFGGIPLLRTGLAGGRDEPSWWSMHPDGGRLLFSGSTGQFARARLLAVSRDTRVTQWAATLDGNRLPGDPATFNGSALAVDDAGHVLVGGSAAEASDVREVRTGGGSFAVLKRTGATGGDFPCGDGQQSAGEACDDGNATDGDGCDTTCRPSGCGSGRVSGTEECDDGNTTGGDGCSATCVREPGCAALDVRGRWEAEIACQLWDAFGLYGFPMYLRGTLVLDVAEECSTGALEVRLPQACGEVAIDDGARVPLACPAASEPITGRIADDGHGVVLDDLTAALALTAPLTAPVTCELESLQTAGPFSAGAILDRRGHASELTGDFAPTLTLHNPAGATCLERRSASDFCVVTMRRAGIADGTCEVGCDDADTCTTDGCDAFGRCTNALVTEGTSGAICRLRHDVASGEACAGDRGRPRLEHLLARLDPHAIESPPAWLVHAELRVVRRVKAAVRRLGARDALSRPCRRAVLANLRAVAERLRETRRSGA